MSTQQKISVAVLGATGAVGQRFIQLLANHPWFEITALAASERSAGKPYAEAANWIIPGDPPPGIGEMVVRPLETDLPARIVFSALPSDVAYKIEPEYAQAGYAVCTNASTYRQAQDVPLLIPDINSEHVALVERQRQTYGWAGIMVASPNCTATGPAMALKPLDAAFGVRKVFMASLQAISGAGHPGVPSLDIFDNVIPYIKGEAEKFEPELRKMLGQMVAGQLADANLVLSPHVHRVPVLDGHTVSLSVGFERKPSVDEALAALRDYAPPAIVRKLPSAPAHPIVVRLEPDRPQPRRDRDNEGGMAVTVGRVRPCPLLDLGLTTVIHNTLRGAASGSILNAELLVAAGYVQ